MECPVIFTKASSMLPLITSKPDIRLSALFTSGRESRVFETWIIKAPPRI